MDKFMDKTLSFRNAEQKDVPLILGFIRELADYEHMLDEEERTRFADMFLNGLIFLTTRSLLAFVHSIRAGPRNCIIQTVSHSVLHNLVRRQFPLIVRVINNLGF